MGGPGSGARRRAAGLTVPNYWLVKTEPLLRYDDLEREHTAGGTASKTPWRSEPPIDALGRPGTVYHTRGRETVVGWATSCRRVPGSQEERPEARRHRSQGAPRLPKPVTLAQIKADKTFADLPIVRQGRCQ